VSSRAVVVISPGRSGSSLVAGLLAGHGVWVGETRPPDQWNPRGYFENTELKRALVKRFGRDWLGAFPQPDDQCPSGAWQVEVARILKAQGYETGPWAFKGGAFYWKVWQPFEPVFIKVWREPGAILRSYRRCRFLNKYTESQAARIVARQHEAMAQIAGPDIMADQVAAGRGHAFRPALEPLGIAFDREIFEALINPDLWTP